MKRRFLVTCGAAIILAGLVTAGLAGSGKFKQSEVGMTTAQISGSSSKVLSSRVGEGIVFHLRAAPIKDGNGAQDPRDSQQLGKASQVGEPENTISAPTVFALRANYPNPFRPSTVIEFDLPEDRHVELSVFDVRGRRVATLVNRNVAVGRHVVTWQATDVAAGLYFYRFRAGDFVEVRRMILMQ